MRTELILVAAFAVVWSQAQVRPRQLDPAIATVNDEFAQVLSVRELADGRVLI
jgi:hypothetical protein